MNEVGKLSTARIRYAERLLERLAREKVEEEEERGEYDTRGDENGESRCTMERFCVGIVGTEKRLDHRYLLQSVASLRGIGGVGADCQTDKLFVQIRGDPLLLHERRKENEVHADVRLMLDAGIDVDYFRSPYRLGQTYVDGKGVTKKYRLDGTVRGKMQWFSDEVDDYRHALDRCLSESPTAPYVLIVEEDVFATRDLMGKLTSAVEFLELKHEGEWSSLKLFVTDYWQNWERKPADVALLVVGGVLLACLCELSLKAFYLAVLVRRWPATEGGDESRLPPSKGVHSTTVSRFQQGVHVEAERDVVVVDSDGCERKRRRKSGFLSFRNLCGERISARRKWVLRAHLFSLGVAILLAVSKQALHLSRVSRRGIYADDMGSHTLGMVFPRHVAAEIVSFLEKTDRPLPIDVLLLKFNEGVVEEGKGQFIIVPSLLQHTGMVSSSTAKVKFQQSVGDLDFYRNDMKFASKFDDLSAEKLEGYSRT